MMMAQFVSVRPSHPTTEQIEIGNCPRSNCPRSSADEATATPRILTLTIPPWTAPPPATAAPSPSKSHFRIERPRSSEALDPRRNRPLNRFNLYYIIERERLLQSIDGYQPDEADGQLPPDIVTGYEGLELPELPKRYRHIKIADDW